MTQRSYSILSLLSRKWRSKKLKIMKAFVESQIFRSSIRSRDFYCLSIDIKNLSVEFISKARYKWFFQRCRDRVFSSQSSKVISIAKLNTKTLSTHFNQQVHDFELDWHQESINTCAKVEFHNYSHLCNTIIAIRFVHAKIVMLEALVN